MVCDIASTIWLSANLLNVAIVDNGQAKMKCLSKYKLLVHVTPCICFCIWDVCYNIIDI